MASEGYHETAEHFSATRRAMHNASVPRSKKSEATDWYEQCIEACQNAALKRVLEHDHGKGEEHTTMVIAWMRCQDSTLSSNVGGYFFTDKPIALT